LGIAGAVFYKLNALSPNEQRNLNKNRQDKQDKSGIALENELKGNNHLLKFLGL